MRLGARIGLATVVAICATAAGAEEFRWLAFGDSITLGNYDSTPPPSGYPMRLNDLLNCSPGVCEVYNAGKSGERTYQGVTRIDNVLDNQGPFDVMMLMEGTNDIFQGLSVESVVTNLGIMASKARARGTDTVHASIIWFHPNGTHGTTKDDEVEALRDSLALLADAYHRYFVDIWDVLCPDSHPDVHGHNQNQCFNQHYADACPGSPPPCGDNRGHPVHSGYNMMAYAYYAGLLSAPLPGALDPLAPQGIVGDAFVQFRWDRELPVVATWYQVVIEQGSSTVLDLWLEARTRCDSITCSYWMLVPLADGEYTWKVRGRNPAGHGEWTSDTTFQVESELLFTDGFESGDISAWSDPS